MDRFELGLAACIAAIVGLFVFALFAAAQEQRAWEAYAKEHQCVENPERYRPVNSISATPVVGSIGKGVGTGVAVQPRTKWEYAWECANGEVHWR